MQAIARIASHHTGTIKCILLLINLNVRLMWLLCSLTLSAFCFLFPLSIQLQRPPHTFLSCSALSVWYFLCAIDVRCVHLAILLWRRAEWMISAHHESFGQWSEQRNEFLFEKFLIRWLFFGVRLLIFFNGIIINLLVAEKKTKRNWGDEMYTWCTANVHEHSFVV